jgi:hypothetical protein
MDYILYMFTIGTDLTLASIQKNRLFRTTALFMSSWIDKTSTPYNGAQTALSRPRHCIH